MRGLWPDVWPWQACCLVPSMLGIPSGAQDPGRCKKRPCLGGCSRSPMKLSAGGASIPPRRRTNIAGVLAGLKERVTKTWCFSTRSTIESYPREDHFPTSICTRSLCQIIPIEIWLVEVIQRGFYWECLSVWQAISIDRSLMDR